MSLNKENNLLCGNHGREQVTGHKNRRVAPLLKTNSIEWFYCVAGVYSSFRRNKFLSEQPYFKCDW